MKKNYIGIREARINLSKLIRDVRSGMEIIITDRGTPVARLVPSEGQNLSLEERIKNYEYCGLIEAQPQKEQRSAAPIQLPEDFLDHGLGDDPEHD